MSEPPDDRILQDYLHRKSALSMGYKRVYIETPPPELDQAITARARRALKWLVPAALALFIALTFVLGINFGVTKWVGMLVKAERNVNRMKEERKEQEEKEEKERAEAPVSVIIDANSLIATSSSNAQLSKEEWLVRIERLRKAGKQAEAREELTRLKAAYPEQAAPTK